MTAATAFILLVALALSVVLDGLSRTGAQPRHRPERDISTQKIIVDLTRPR